MKNIKLKSYLFQVVVLLAVMLLFTECRNNAKVERGVNTFFATFFFIIFMILGGIPAIIFSAISVKTITNAMKILGIVFVSIFGFFCLISIAMYSEFWRKGSRDWISVLALIQFGSLVASIVFLSSGASNRSKLNAQNPSIEPEIIELKPEIPKKDDDEIDYMDEILND